MTTPGCPRNTLGLTRGSMGGTTWTVFASVLHIRSFRFIFILRVAPQQTHAAVAVVRAGYPSPDYRQNQNRRKSKEKLTKMQLHDILRRDCSKSGLPYFPYFKA